MALQDITRGGTNSPISGQSNPEGVVYSKNEAGRKKVGAWLASVFNYSLHAKNIVLSAVLNGTNAVTNVSRFKGAADLHNFVAGIGAAANAAAEALAPGGSALSPTAVSAVNAIADELKNPNIDGIPIHAITELEGTDIEVSQKMLISEVNANKQLVMDNAAPQPRTWTIKGYLMSNPNLPMEASFIIKPSLIAQRKLLQMYADSRRPVLFKTHDNRFAYVMITHFDSQYEVNSLNSLSVNISLLEFKALSVDSSDLGLTQMEIE